MVGPVTDLHHRRTQFPVGEGLFHAALLSSSSGDRLTYVYDCGSQQRYAAARRSAIADYRSRLGDRPLDLLYLSHAHADHVNGVPDLLDDLAVGTIVMPLLGAYERLVAFARSLATEPEAPGGFFEDWVVDPVAAAVAQGPERVVVVRPATPGAAPPGASPETEPDPDPDWDPQLEPRSWYDPVVESNRRDRPRLPQPWDFTGPGTINAREVEGPHGSTAVVEMPDTVGIRPNVGGDAQPWVLAPHVSPSLATRRTAFFGALAKAIGGDPATIESDLDDPYEMRKLIVEQARALLGAYRVVRADVNLTSLCLYSGPAGAPERAHRRSWRSSQDFVTAVIGPVTGWLGTGDARLSSRRHRRAIVTHLDTLLPLVQTATLAHHGASNGFSDELLSHVPAALWVAPAAPYQNWKHPHPDVERAVEHAGRQVVHVDADSRSVFEEDFRLPATWPFGGP